VGRPAPVPEEARSYPAFRAQSRVWCTLTANGHSSTIGNGFIRPLMRLDGPGLSDLIRLRTREGMKVAKAKGRLRGKQPKLNRRQEAHLVSLVHSGEYSTAEVAELFGVGRSTVYRALERQRLEARAGLAQATSKG